VPVRKTAFQVNSMALSTKNIDQLASKMGVQDATEEMRENPPELGMLVAHGFFRHPCRLVRLDDEYAYTKDQQGIAWRFPRTEIFDAELAKHLADRHLVRLKCRDDGSVTTEAVPALRCLIGS